MLDFATLTLPPSPNAYLLCPPGVCLKAESHGPAPTFAKPPAAVAEALDRALAREPRVTLGARSAEPLQIEYVQRSLILRFADDVAVRLLPTPEGGAQMAIYSRSRVGYSDLGVNRKRVERLVANVEAELGAAR